MVYYISILVGFIDAILCGLALSKGMYIVALGFYIFAVLLLKK